MTEQAAIKCLYLATCSLDPTGRGRARWVVYSPDRGRRLIRGSGRGKVDITSRSHHGAERTSTKARGEHAGPVRVHQGVAEWISVATAWSRAFSPAERLGS